MMKFGILFTVDSLVQKLDLQFPLYSMVKIRNFTCHQIMPDNPSKKRTKQIKTCSRRRSPVENEAPILGLNELRTPLLVAAKPQLGCRRHESVQRNGTWRLFEGLEGRHLAPQKVHRVSGQ